MALKPLALSYELAWRTKGDEDFMKSNIWRIIRPRILKRDDYTCRYCGHRSEKGMHVNHIDGNPKNNNDDNLEVVCNMCHMITHSGLFCAVFGIIEVYAESGYDQNDIIRITRKMRQEGKTDAEIRQFLGLRKRVPWRQDLKYLSRLYGFVSSRKPTRRSPKPLLTEDEQKEALKKRENW